MVHDFSHSQLQGTAPEVVSKLAHLIECLHSIVRIDDIQGMAEVY
jgi:hypothetical protein